MDSSSERKTPLSLHERKVHNRQAIQKNATAIRLLMRNAKTLHEGAPERVLILEELAKKHEINFRLQSIRDVYDCTHKWKLTEHADDGDHIECENCSWEWIIPCMKSTLVDSVWGVLKGTV